ncbi:putative hypothetical protein [Streptomyces sp. NBRC 110611]|uniref:hypothetical protein n=1 Tax=Streptomyces sp. NBRC 110611 TaxID=1621259 RepID=UPI000833BB44|nr:hypothetical protein [Streptomyces sp. NBRC 110611]GAU67664.1 putative hypothetical protein [Streptomyces sp. NBRC 110611]
MTPRHDKTRNLTRYRVTATWPARTVTFSNSDRRQVNAKARKWAKDGALVVVERAKSYEWQHDRTFDGPAMLAEQEQARAEAEAAAHRRAVDEQLAKQTARFVERVLAEHAEAEHDRHARLMQRPPVPRRAEGRLTAAHVVAGRGIR